MIRKSGNRLSQQIMPHAALKTAAFAAAMAARRRRVGALVKQRIEEKRLLLTWRGRWIALGIEARFRDNTLRRRGSGQRVGRSSGSGGRWSGGRRPG
jgi:uncharacterized membrane protein YgcG